jgi:YQGE family putative transporter
MASAIILYGVFSPVLSLIMNVFFWRTSKNIQAIILFNCIAFLLLPLVNYLSGTVMKVIPPKVSLAFSFLLIAASPLILFIQYSEPFLIAVIMGVIYAFSRGIFFSNRNFLEINLTEDGQRFYVSITSFFNESFRCIHLRAGSSF